MTRTVLGIIGGSGVYDIAGLRACPLGARDLALGRAERPASVRHVRRRRSRLPAAPRPRPHPVADHDQLPRQYRRAEARRRHRRDLDVACGSFREELRAGHLRDRRPVHRPHLRAREDVLRRGLRGACLDGPSHRSQARGRAVRCRARGRRAVRERRHLSGDGRPAILDARRNRCSTNPGAAR